MQLKNSRKLLEFNGRCTSCVEAGSGEPAVILLSGLGETIEGWAPLIEIVSKRTKIFAYDRPGYGGSTLVRHDKNGRDGHFVASHLKACLNAAGIAAPYLLVGHSMGGLYALCYANLFREDVTGIVTLDMRAPTYSSSAERRKPGSSRPSRLLTPFLPYRVSAEITGAPAAERQAAAPEELGDLPITMIAASESAPGLGKGFLELWQGEQRAFAERLANGRFIFAENAGHDIHREQPGLVVREIVSIMGRAID